MSACDWTDAYGDPCPLSAEVLRRADEFFDAVEAGTVDLSEAVPVDEFIAEARKRWGAGRD